MRRAILVTAVGIGAILLAPIVAIGGDFSKAKAVAVRAKSAADPQKGIDEVLDLFAAAKAEYREALEGGTDGSALLDLGKLLQSKGLFLKGRIDAEPKLAARYREAAQEAYDAAILEFRAAAMAFGKVPRNLSVEKRVALDWSRRQALFYAAASYHALALLSPEGGTARGDALRKGILHLTDFVWDNEDNILGGYAYLYLGLCHKELGQAEKAIEFLAVAAKSFPVPPKGSDEYRKWTDLFLQSYYKLGEYENELGRKKGRKHHEAACRVLRSMHMRVPDLWERKWGHFALLEQARALYELGRFREALELAKKLSEKGEELSGKQPWAAGTAYLANRLLGEIQGDSPGKMDPATLMKIAMGVKLTRDWAGAERAFQAVIDACETAKEIREFEIPARMQIGECRYRAEDFRGAYQAYDEILKSFEKLDPDLAGDAAYFRYRSATALHAASRETDDEALKRKARAAFVEKFSKHPRAIDLRYYAGVDRVTAGDAYAADEQEAKAKGEYEEAVRLLSTMSKSAALYPMALARIAEARYKSGETEKALGMIATLDDFLTQPKFRSSDPASLSHRRRAQIVATYYKALCHARLEQWEQVLAVLDGFEETFTEAGAKAFIGAVKYERSRAMTRLYNLDRAFAEALRLKEQNGDPGRAIMAFKYLARTYEQLLVKEGEDREEVLALLEPALFTKPELEEVLGKIRAVPSTMEGLSRVYLEIGGEKKLLRALTLLGILTRADPVQSYTPGWWEWQHLMFRCYLALGGSDPVALGSIRSKYEQWESLGVLQHCPCREELMAIYEKAK